MRHRAMRPAKAEPGTGGSVAVDRDEVVAGANFSRRGWRLKGVSTFGRRAFPGTQVELIERSITRA
jgi:hypothetical protein